jgi:4-diphosphocytidyl-2-C-methyl-D-erythritol kinase
MHSPLRASEDHGIPAFALRAPAKINLTLEVLARRGDGYHGVRSVIVPLALADEIEIAPGAHLTFECDDPVLGGEENLALRAARAVEAATGRSLRTRIALRKRIPARAGLGGGSSDAATILLAAVEGLFGQSLSLDALEIARSLGSDVPFFLAQTGALVEGTGERVTALGALPSWHVVIVKPPVAVSTAEAYRMLDRRERSVRPRNDSVSIACASALQRGDFDLVERLLSNDFHDLAMEHEPIRRAADALREAGAARPLLAGSGSAVFALMREAAQRDAIAERLNLAHGFAVFRTELARSSAWRA